MLLRPGPLALLVLAACAAPRSSTPLPPAAGPVVISVVATTDLHGHLESLPWLGGHLANLRAARAADGGGVLLVDSGDMFQGTLESNLSEGAAVVRAYGALGYAAVAIGNHEFDYGPPGPGHVPRGPHEDPQGALKLRAREARFPFLAANLRAAGGGAAGPVAWPNVQPGALVEVAGVPVGIVGVTTFATPRATHPRSFAGLDVAPLAEAMAAAARSLRARGAVAVVAAAHAGGQCGRLDAPDDLSSCDPAAEIFAVARALPAGLVDVVAGGHTHQGMAHRVAGIPVVQAFADGRAFARVDLTVDRAARRVTAARIFAPRWLCDAASGRGPPSFAADACSPPPYEGRPVRHDGAVAAVLAADVARAAEQRRQPVGVTLTAPIRRAVTSESALGNLAADAMRAAPPAVDVAFTNGGGLRADLPAGALSYGQLFEAFPFDDAPALLDLTARELAAVVARNLQRRGGILSLSGVRARASCRQGALVVELTRPDGRPLPDDTRLVVRTNGYLASGGDGLLQGLTARHEDGPPLRDLVAAALAARGGTLRGDDPALFDPAARRLDHPGRRPVECR